MEMLDGMCWHSVGDVWERSSIYFLPRISSVLSRKVYYWQVNFFTNNYTQDESDHKRTKWICLRQGDKTHAHKSRVWELCARCEPCFSQNKQTQEGRPWNDYNSVIILHFLCSSLSVHSGCIYLQLTCRAFGLHQCWVGPLSSFCRILWDLKNDQAFTSSNSHELATEIRERSDLNYYIPSRRFSFSHPAIISSASSPHLLALLS